ncbi:MAG: hypothetical protein M0021_14090 [Clostridia bacterium]|nr:hypothetical protein [Clostridia bacterium]
MAEKKKEPAIAPGMEYLLDKKATAEERKKGNTTKVTTLEYDEVED